jgi:hypothetical protein
MLLRSPSAAGADGGTEGRASRARTSLDGSNGAPRVFPKDYIRVGCLQKKSIGTTGVFWSPVCICFRVHVVQSMQIACQSVYVVYMDVYV